VSIFRLLTARASSFLPSLILERFVCHSDLVRPAFGFYLEVCLYAYSRQGSLGVFLLQFHFFLHVADQPTWVCGSGFGSWCLDLPLCTSPGLRFLSLVSLICSRFDVCLDPSPFGGN